MTLALRQTDVVLDDKGYPVVNGYFYVGTYQTDPVSNPLSLFSDVTLTTPIANPQRTDSYGRPENDIYIAFSRYSYLIKNSAGTTIEGPKDRVPFGNASQVALDQGGSVQDAIDYVTPRMFDAVCDGVADDTSFIQAALDSGAAVVDFMGLPNKCDEITVPAGVICRNMNLSKKTAGGNMVLVNDGCQLHGKLTGTGTLSTTERGVYPAANNVQNVSLDLECASLTYGVHGQPLSGTAYADAPKRWGGTLRFTDIAGTTGESEGYGLLLSPGHSCKFDIFSKSSNARHIVYLSAGASDNIVNAEVDGCTNYAAQIYSTGAQPASERNTINIKCVNLTETVAGQSGAVAIVGNAHDNKVTFDIKDAGGAISFAGLVEGSSGGPYPKANKIVDGSAYGQFTGADVIRTINADSTIISRNTLRCYGTFSVISIRRSGTNGAAHAGYVDDNIIDGLAQNVVGIYDEANAQPSWIGPNQISNNGTSLRVNDSTGGKRQGASRRATFSGTTASVSATDSGDTTVTLSQDIQTTGRRTNVTLTGSSVTFFGVPICIIGVLAPPSASQAQFRMYNGAGSAQTFNYEGVVEGD